MKKIKQPFHAFTIRHSTRVPRITTDIFLAKASDPIAPPQNIGSLAIQALWDTGATRSVVTQASAQALGLIPTGTTIVNHAGGSSPSNTYVVNFYLPNSVVIQGVLAVECPNIAGNFGAIIGMDIICNGDLSITNVDNQTWMTFRIPSYKPTDYVAEANRIVFAGVKSYHPCPCSAVDNNGKPLIFSKCHGANL